MHSGRRDEAVTIDVTLAASGAVGPEDVRVALEGVQFAQHAQIFCGL